MTYKKELIEEVKKLLEKGESYRTIAETLSIYENNVAAIKQGFESHYEYQEHLARKKGFESYHEYQEHLARKKGFESHYEYQKHLAREMKFKSLSEYQEHLARKKGFKSRSEYQKHLKYIELVPMLVYEGGISFEVFELAFEDGVHDYIPIKIRKLAESETSFFYIENGELRLKHDHPYLLQDGRLEKILKKVKKNLEDIL